MADSADDLKPRGVLKLWKVLLLLVPLLAGAALAGYSVGVLAAPQGYFWINPRGAAATAFDWSNAALAATAAGTVILAAFTAALAFTTSGDVSATWELATLTARDQQARELPVLVVTRVEIVDISATEFWAPAGEAAEPATRVEVVGSVRNVGLGPAINAELVVTYSGPYPDVTPRSDTRICPVVVPNESDSGQKFNFWRPGSSAEIQQSFAPGDFVLTATCQDRQGRRAPEAVDPNRAHEQAPPPEPDSPHEPG